jgi:hypothetical protein
LTQWPPNSLRPIGRSTLALSRISLPRVLSVNIRYRTESTGVRRFWKYDDPKSVVFVNKRIRLLRILIPPQKTNFLDDKPPLIALQTLQQCTLARGLLLLTLMTAGTSAQSYKPLLRWLSNHGDPFTRIAQSAHGICILTSGDSRLSLQFSKARTARSSSLRESHLCRFLRSHAPFGILGIWYCWNQQGTEMRAFTITGTPCGKELGLRYSFVPAPILRQIVASYALPERVCISFPSDPAHDLTDSWISLPNLQMQ